MTKVAKKFHLDPDGYLTTKPDRQFTTEEEATGAAEAAIGEALEEGGSIAEAIAASSDNVVLKFNRDIGSENYNCEKTAKEIYDLITSGVNVYLTENNGSNERYWQSWCTHDISNDTYLIAFTMVTPNGLWNDSDKGIISSLVMRNVTADTVAFRMY